ncbi:MULTISPECIES: ogr/Delta-like zinc finger family protein [unclassified Serratia (in: enterobacteria)]|uniref:ogr/Delta-like zinc finger family protein n=1 Tax=unclassified Serratia (in: enterobacteria) TaxID=2647522 RepID=UPI0009DCB4E1|nr:MULTISPECIES: ogr/Delta-like zinc finger family protein [unclassified Serratia (in: enterobacteria)]
MMHCPLCGHTAHTRSSRYLSKETKERYHQCQNVNCSCTFATHETVARLIAQPQLVAKKCPDSQGGDSGLNVGSKVSHAGRAPTHHRV